VKNILEYCKRLGESRTALQPLFQIREIEFLSGETLLVSLVLSPFGGLSQFWIIARLSVAGYSAAALLAILFCIPFALRVLIHKETGGWSNWLQAFYHAHLELFLGNGCLGTTKCVFLREITRDVCRARCRRFYLPENPTRSLSLFLFLFSLSSFHLAKIRDAALAVDGAHVIHSPHARETYERSLASCLSISRQLLQR